MNAQVALEIADGPLRGRHPAIRLGDGLRFNQEVIAIPQPALLRVGRALDCHICLPADDDQVSRRHFLLEVGNGGVRVRDCGSRNGTFVNGVELARAVAPDPASPAPESRPGALELKDGDRILAGQTVFRVRIADCAVQDNFVLQMQHEIVPPRVEVHEESSPNPCSRVALLSRSGVPAERRTLSEEEDGG
ncbi:MAG TPA: FHA domain-containing protein, partial [Verrucomicrobiae bacterium]